MTMSNGVPVVEGLFQVEAGIATLRGSRCQGCGAHSFPSRSRCANPACPGGEMEAVALPRRGQLYSHTFQAYQPPPLFRMAPWQPYSIGVVELLPGLRVLSMLACADPATLRIGMEMELVAGRIGTTDEGQPLLTYQFAPVGVDGARA